MTDWSVMSGLVLLYDPSGYFQHINSGGISRFCTVCRYVVEPLGEGGMPTANAFAQRFKHE